jgi:ketosteroid isomerase-like protein
VDDPAEVVRRFWSSPLSDLADVVDEDIDYRAIEGAPDDVGVMRGRDALVRYLADWDEMFEGFTVQLEEIETLSPEDVVVVGRVSGRARVSGVQTEQRLSILYTVRGGLIVRGREYRTKEEALAAAGRAG